MVSPESSSVSTRNDGSSAIIFPIAMPIFSEPPLSFGFTAIEITGSGKIIGSSVTGCLGSQRVWPVCTFFMPTIAIMSPAWARSISLRSSACISTIRPIRSVFPVNELSIVSPLLSTPEYTRTKVSAPNRSSMILKASAFRGSAVETIAFSPVSLPSSSVRGCGSTSVGQGR